VETAHKVAKPRKAVPTANQEFH